MNVIIKHLMKGDILSIYNNMDIKEEVKQVVILEAKSAYYKGRVVGAIVEKGFKIARSQGKFLGRYIKELRK